MSCFLCDGDFDFGEDAVLRVDVDGAVAFADGFDDAALADGGDRRVV